MPSDTTVFTLSQVAEHDDDHSLWVIVHGKVYDVTKYASEHPGGIGVLLEHAGQDATDDFEDVGHSSDAREIMAGFQIGVLEPEKKEKGSGCKWNRLLLPVAAAAALGLAFLVFRLTHRTV